MAVAATETHAPPALVSLIVTTRNSAGPLRACLESAHRQDYPAIEIIVVDNGSTDGTLEIARELADVVVKAGPERSAQRNAGIRIARGRWVAILDSDMVLDADVVSSCVATAEKTGARAICIPETSFGTGYWSRCKSFEREFYKFDAVVTAARFFDRAHVVALGGYDEALTGPEDWDLSIRASGSTPVFAQGEIRHDEGRQTLSGLFGKRFYYAQSWPAFIRKHGQLAIARISPARASLWRNVGAMLRRPGLTIGLVIMKSVELAGAGLGMLNARQPQPKSLDPAPPPGV
jgi:GT2 family glycosyltransferase